MASEKLLVRRSAGPAVSHVPGGSQSLLPKLTSFELLSYGSSL